MAVVRGAFNKQIAPGARKAYADEYSQLPSFYPTVFNMTTSNKAYEDDLISTGLATTVEKPEGEDVALDEPQHRGTVRYTHTTYGLGYEVTKEMVEDDLYGVVAKPSSRFLARSQRDAEERTAWSIFNLAFTTQEAYDGVALIYDEHPLVGGSTLGNRPSSDVDLSVTALQSSVERYMLLTTDRSLRIKLRPKWLAVPVQNFWLANEILRSEFKPFTADNEINVLRRMGMTPFEVPYLTDSDSWYTVAGKGQHRLNFMWRRKPQMDDDYDKKAQVSLFMQTARWSSGASDWRGIDGSTGA